MINLALLNSIIIYALFIVGISILSEWISDKDSVTDSYKSFEKFYENIKDDIKNNLYEKYLQSKEGFITATATDTDIYNILNKNNTINSIKENIDIKEEKTFINYIDNIISSKTSHLQNTNDPVKFNDLHTKFGYAPVKNVVQNYNRGMYTAKTENTIIDSCSYPTPTYNRRNPYTLNPADPYETNYASCL